METCTAESIKTNTRWVRVLLIHLTCLAMMTLGLACNSSSGDSSQSQEVGDTNPTPVDGSAPSNDDAVESNGDSNEGTESPTDTSENTGDTTGASIDVAEEADATSSDIQQPEPDVPVEEKSVCEEWGFPEAPYLPGTGSDYGKVAGFFSAETLTGTWKLDEEWTGCDTYVFINYTGDNTFWNADLSLFINKTAPNTHYFFSGYGNQEDVYQKVLELKSRMDSALSALPASVAQQLSPRLHFVTTPATEIQGSVGVFLKKQTIPVLAIDRAQKFHQGASMAIVSGGGFVSQITQSVWLGRYFNYLAKTAETLAEDQDEVTLVPLFSQTEVTANNATYTAEFPSAEEMAGYDTMIADLRVSCGPGPNDCGEWDYEAFIQLCEDDTCESVNEILVWITPYSRPGTKHWTIDMSPFIGLLKDGGTRTFKFGMLWNMNANVLDLDFRLSNRGKGYASRTVVPLFTGGDFGGGYNDKYEPVTVDVPESTLHSELVVIVSGHGQEAGNNCAEWCNHQHEFTVNGTTAYTKDHAGQAGTQYGCAEQVDEGVVPGQYGNWAPGRAAWCPGLPVHPWVVDLSEDLTPGGNHEITYRGLYQGGEPAGGRIRLNSFLVLYE